jgi:hypothetical protein
MPLPFDITIEVIVNITIEVIVNITIEVIVNITMVRIVATATRKSIWLFVS